MNGLQVKEDTEMNESIRKYLPVLTGSLIFSLLILLTTMPTFAAASASATRDIQTELLTPGNSTNVTVTITNDLNQALSLKENIPSGWTLTRVSDGADSYKASTHEWVWFSVAAGSTKTVIYTLTVPSNATLQEYNITGFISNATESLDVGGETSITVSEALPTLQISANPTTVTVGVPTPVTFTVTSSGTPVEAQVLVESRVVGTTNASTGTLVVNIPAIPSPGIINVTAHNPSYINGTTTLTVVPAPEALSITASQTEVPVGIPTTVIFTVTSAGLPKQARVTLSGELGSGITNATTGQTEIIVNATVAGEIIATAERPGFTNGTTTIRAVVPAAALSITASVTEVTVGIPTEVTFTVTSNGAPVRLADVVLSGMATGSDRTDANGTALISVNATGAGEIIATASRSGFTNGTTVISAVPPLAPLSITASPTEVTVGIPTQVTFTVTSNGAPVQLANVVLSGMATGSDRTDANGTALISVNATGAGVITATASRSGFTEGTTTITAIPAVVQTLVITTPTTLVTVGEETLVTFTVTSAGAPVSGVSVSLSGAATGNGITDPAGIATISTNATIEGTITATASKTGYVSGITTFSAHLVEGPELTTITVSPATATVTIGNTTTFTAITLDQFGAPIGVTVTWTSSNMSVGTITSTGVFTAIGAGTTTITAANGPVSGTATVTVVRSADINGDHIIDYKDLGILGVSYGLSAGQPGFNPLADLNSDGVIDYKDLGILGAHYGESV